MYLQPREGDDHTIASAASRRCLKRRTQALTVFLWTSSPAHRAYTTCMVLPPGPPPEEAGWVAFELLKQRVPSLRFDATAGLSLGEFTALAAAGAFSFEAGLELVRRRQEQEHEPHALTVGSIEVHTRRASSQRHLACEPVRCTPPSQRSMPHCSTRSS